MADNTISVRLEAMSECNCCRIATRLLELEPAFESQHRLLGALVAQSGGKVKIDGKHIRNYHIVTQHLEDGSAVICSSQPSNDASA